MNPISKKLTTCLDDVILTSPFPDEQKALSAKRVQEVISKIDTPGSLTLKDLKVAYECGYEYGDFFLNYFYGYASLTMRAKIPHLNSHLQPSSFSERIVSASDRVLELVSLKDCRIEEWELALVDDDTFAKRASDEAQNWLDVAYVRCLEIGEEDPRIQPLFESICLKNQQSAIRLEQKIYGLSASNWACLLLPFGKDKEEIKRRIQLIPDNMVFEVLRSEPFLQDVVLKNLTNSQKSVFCEDLSLQPHL
jgi:hypothetical protein